MKIFSKRNRGEAQELIFSIPEITRSKLLHTLNQVVENPVESFGQRSFEELVQEIGSKLLREYGALRASSYVAARRSAHPVVEHFFCCDDEEVLDFLELCFRSFRNSPRQAGVDAINEIFREDGVGYQLTPWVETEVENPEPRTGPPWGGKQMQITYPVFIRVDNQFAFQNIIAPSLQILSQHFTVANDEMSKAHGAFRTGHYDAVITACGAALESTLKTICHRKKWPYDKYRDTCAGLIEVCRKNKLFPEFYTEALKSAGTIRNRLGDAHGRGPQPDHVANMVLAEHMLNLTASHILLLARLSGMC